MAAHQFFELLLGLALQGGVVDALDLAVLHHAAAIDVAGDAVVAAPGQHQVFQRIEQRPQVQAAQAEHRDVGLGPRRQAAEIITAQRLGAAEGGGVVQVQCAGQRVAALHQAGDVQALAHVVQQIRRPGVGAQSEVDALGPIAAERVQRLAIPGEHHRAMHQARAAIHHAVAGRHRPGCRCRGAAGCADSTAQAAATSPAVTRRAVARPSPPRQVPGSNANASVRSVRGSVRRCVAAAPACRSGCGPAAAHPESGRRSRRRNPEKTLRRIESGQAPGFIPVMRQRAVGLPVTHAAHVTRAEVSAQAQFGLPHRPPPQTRRRSPPTRGSTSR